METLAAAIQLNEGEQLVCWNCGIGMSNTEIQREVLRARANGVEIPAAEYKYFMCSDCHHDQEQHQSYIASFDEDYDY